MTNRNTTIILICLTLLCSALFESTALATTPSDTSTDWPMFHHDPTLAGATNGSAPKSVPSVLWSIESKGYASVSPAVANGIVYASTLDLYAYNASTGEALWSVPNGGQSSPIVADGVVYTGAYHGTAYNASTGAVIWSVGNQDSYNSGVAFYDGYFYTKDDSGYLQARNATTGNIIWTSTSTGYYLYPAISDGYIYCNSYNGTAVVSAINAYDGTLMWQTLFDIYELRSNPAFSSGYVYWGCDDGNVYCLDGYTGEVVWNYSTDGWVRSSPAVAYGYVYVGSLDRDVYALNASTGEKIWSFTTGASSNSYGVNSSPAVANGVVYIGADDGKLYALDAYRGTQLWSLQVQSELDTMGATQSFSSAPAVSNGKIYIISMDHFITVLFTTTNQFNLLPNGLIVFALVFLVVAVLLFFRRIRNKASDKRFNFKMTA